MMYNYENIESVLDHIEKHRESFDMKYYCYPDPECGTIACLAGWTCILLDPDYDLQNNCLPVTYYHEMGQKLLGLPDEECELFYTFNNSGEVILLLKSAVRQKDWEDYNRQTLTEIAVDLGLKIFS